MVTQHESLVIVALPGIRYRGTRLDLLRKAGIGMNVLNPHQFLIPRPKPLPEYKFVCLPGESRTVTAGDSQRVWWTYRPSISQIDGDLIDGVPLSWIKEFIQTKTDLLPMD